MNFRELNDNAELELEQMCEAGFKAYLAESGEIFVTNGRETHFVAHEGIEDFREHEADELVRQNTMIANRVREMVDGGEMELVSGLDIDDLRELSEHTQRRIEMAHDHAHENDDRGMDDDLDMGFDLDDDFENDFGMDDDYAR